MKIEEVLRELGIILCSDNKSRGLEEETSVQSSSGLAKDIEMEKV